MKRRVGSIQPASKGASPTDTEALLAAFGLLFVMEMGDKTQLAVLGLSAKTGRVWSVFLGASLALSLVTALGAVVGAGVAHLVPGDWLSRAAAIAFIAIGAIILWKTRSAAGDSEESGKPKDRGVTHPSRGAFGVAATSFGLLFLAEMGDKTQLAVITLTAKTGSGLSVLAGAAAALTLLTLFAALAGKAILKLVPLRWVSRIAGLAFVASGALSLAGVF